jgi:arylsulfatase A-like enzyme
MLPMAKKKKSNVYPRIIHSLILYTYALTFSACSQFSNHTQRQTTTQSSKPNIVFILVDDMGFGEPSYAGGIIPTPAIDSIAQEGIQFTDAHTSSSVCPPTRYSILTGRYNWRSRLKSAALVKTTSPALMDSKRYSLAKMLQQSGYYTGLVGKWHLGVDWQLLVKSADPEPFVKHKHKKQQETSWLVDYSKPFKNGPIDQGFNEAFFILSSLDMPPYVYLKDKKATSIPTVNKGFLHNEYNDYQRIGAATEDFEASTVLAKWASKSKRFIQQQAKNNQQPFFLHLSLTSPHTPVTPGEKFKGKYPKYSMYADFMAETDWVVAEVLSELQATGIDDNTIVIFTSDNGFAPYVEIPKMLAAGYQPSGPFRGAKANIYEGGHRVPFLVKWPQHIAPNTVSKQTISSTDIFATFADILGVKYKIPDNAAEDSFSFYDNLLGKDRPVRPFTIHHSISGKFAIRQDDWKLILTTDNGGGWDLPWQKLTTPAKVVQLYNLKNDIAETQNLESKHPEKVNELVALLASAIREGRTTPGNKQNNEGWPFKNKQVELTFPTLSNPTKTNY